MGVETMRKILRTQVIVAIVAMTIGVCGTMAQAALLAPGGIQFPVAAAPVNGGVELGGSPLVSPFNVPLFFTGTLTSRVYSGDPTNALGGLTFTYLLQNSAASPNAIAGISLNDFAGFATDVSYVAPPAGLIPANALRSAAGNSITYNYDGSGAGPLQPGLTSALLVIRTNAPAFNVSAASIIDSGSISIPMLGPAVPEPASLGLVSLGMAMAIRRRNRA